MQTVRWLMENEIELLNQTEADLLILMRQYKSGQYTHLADCINKVRAVRDTLRHLTPRSPDSPPAGEIPATWVFEKGNIVPPAISG